MRETKRKNVLVSVIVISTLLIASSIIAISEAWGPRKRKPEYVGYALVLNGAGDGAVTFVDTSGAPNNVVIEGTSGTLLGANVTIDDKVYYYPKDFDYSHVFHFEFNAITGKGLLRSEATITFKMRGRPIVSDWTVTRVSGYRVYPNATLIAPEEVTYEGTFQLSGSGQFNKVEGFGLGEGYMVPPYYNNTYIRHFGYIKGWPY